MRVRRHLMTVPAGYFHWILSNTIGPIECKTAKEGRFSHRMIGAKNCESKVLIHNDLEL